MTLIGLASAKQTMATLHGRLATIRASRGSTRGIRRRLLIRRRAAAIGISAVNRCIKAGPAVGRPWGRSWRRRRGIAM